MSVYDDDDYPSSLLLASLPSPSPMVVDDESTPTTIRRRRREWLASPGIIIIFFLDRILNFVFLAVDRNQLKHHFCVGMFCWQTIGCIEYHTLLGLTAHTMTNNMNFNTRRGARYLGMRGKGVRLHCKVIAQRDQQMTLNTNQQR